MDPERYKTVIRELEAALRADPSDAELWQRLGELYFHERTVDLEWNHRAHAQSALERAVELEPAINEYAFHLFELALQSHDEELFRRVLDAGEAAAPGAEALRGWRLAHRAVFGDASGPELIAIVDSIAVPGNIPARGRVSMVTEALAVTRWAEAEAVVSHIRDRLRSCWVYALDAGKLDWYLADVMERAGPAVVSCAYLAYAMDLPVPERLLDSLFEANPAAIFGPFYALDRGRPDEYETALANVHQWAEDLRPTIEDTAAFRSNVEAYDSRIRAYEQWKVQGRLAEAERTVLAIPIQFRPRVMLVKLREEAGDAAGAARALQAIADSYGELGPLPRSLALYRLGPLYEQLGREAEARAVYAEFLQRWREADPALQPMVDSARAALTRLGPLDQ
jgi:tetratricopeptide (TPR) repeat protein